MSKRKAFEPSTHVIGAERIEDPIIKGRVSWIPPKPSGQLLVWRSEASKRKFNGDKAAAAKDTKGRDHLQLVPVYRGCPTRLANEIRADIRRRERIAASRSTFEKVKSFFVGGAGEVDRSGFANAKALPA